jgi:hypothetical protein
MKRVIRPGNNITYNVNAVFGMEIYKCRYTS